MLSTTSAGDHCITTARYWPYAREIHRCLVGSPQKGPVTQKIFNFTASLCKAPRMGAKQNNSQVTVPLTDLGYWIHWRSWDISVDVLPRRSRANTATRQTCGYRTSCRHSNLQTSLQERYMSSRASQITGNSTVFFRAHNTRNINAPFCEVDPFTHGFLSQGQGGRKCFHVMTSSFHGWSTRWLSTRL